MTMQTLASIVQHFSRALGDGEENAERAAALAAQATLAGHVCADLDSETGWGPWAAEMHDEQRKAFRACLPALPCVGGADDWTPLVWDGRRLYLRRYWTYEQRVATELRARMSMSKEIDPHSESGWQAQFADAGQRAAARCALTHPLALISGGPGTGKTHTLARIIGLLQEQQALPLRIALAAPTGKAAARMTEALQAAGVTVDGGAQTLHRLLGMRRDGNGFHHHRDRPLATDVLVVDEASMIDLSLMAHLLDALPATARLILLGDRDQLAAVEAGAVFADLCDSPQLAGTVTLLSTSFRFGAESGIGQLAECLRRGDADAAAKILNAGRPDLDWQLRGDARALTDCVREHYRGYLDSVTAALSPVGLFEQFGRFRVLCAHRQDVEAINRAMSGDNLRPDPGMPLMVLRNDPVLRVFNGDIGIVLPDPADGQLKCCFPGEMPRWIPLARLPEWEPAWALTVHKSQGSEFEEVLLVLPVKDSAGATRELVYTGVTRAKRRVTLWADEAVLRGAIERRAERMSGLRDRLR